jgi:uncharacterized protein (UPF0264 family)
VLRVVGGRAPVSAALGELLRGDRDSASALAAQTAGLAFAKIGLAGAAAFGDWPQQWRAAVACLPPRVMPVAVAYADWPAVEAPRPEAVIDAGAELGCSMLLIDTFCKARGDLLSHLPLAPLERVMSRARRHGMQVVLAGSLTKLLVRCVLPLAPALVAVRGAACRPDRRGAIDAALVRELAAILRQSPAEAAAEGWGA